MLRCLSRAGVVCVALAWVPLAPRPSQAAAQIQVSTAPAYGQLGSITGRVTGITDFANYDVVTYLYVDGIGWYPKPTTAQQATALNPDGTFSVPVTTGGVDQYATTYYVGLLPATSSPPAQPNLYALPAPANFVATSFSDRYPASFSFGGFTWAAKGPYGPAGPGGNYYSSANSNIYVDAAGLHLTVNPDGNRFDSTEAILTNHLGYGTYSFTTKYNVNQLSPNLTFGAYTYDGHGLDSRIPDWPFREIDFEDSRWGNAADPTTTQYVVQPYTLNPPHRYSVPNGNVTLTRFFTWQSGSVHFVTLLGNHTPTNYSVANVLEDYTFAENAATGQLVPTPDAENFRFNLWINDGSSAPSNRLPAEVVVSSFGFSAQGSAVWNGASAANGNWSTGGNRQGASSPAAGVQLQFGPTSGPGNQTQSDNNLAAGTQFGGIQFQAGAPSYKLIGNAIALGGVIVNQSGNDQEIELDVQFVGAGGTVDTGGHRLTMRGHVASGVSLIKSGAGTLEIDGSLNWGIGSTIQVVGGNLKFNMTSGAAAVGAGVTTTVAAGATLELAGTISALATAGNRVNVVNNSAASGGGLLVSGRNQQVGNIEGTGTTQVMAGNDLTANHIIQAALVIGGTPNSRGRVTIAPSDSSGNALAESIGLPSDSSLGSSRSDDFQDANRAGIFGSIPLTADGFNSDPIPADTPSHARVPEPSTLVLLSLAALPLVARTRRVSNDFHE